ncbi:dienelactone hydrolase family protein [Parachlamydia sp. AcF125]|uniref:dienelactone hydrolase family protein n=1 Tax=Parachlamydia sp. AcF125 TaxID=2795736 RepID=UPI001BC99ACD|nr:dienelactone hydrolase family protein [Parachlamydia sp. AcF125]MBS4168273.1 hypothetical protein [Parachlamydia sp. AcF125]
MYQEAVPYRVGDVSMQGYLVYDPTSREKKPAIVIAHAWKGQGEFEREKAKQLANLGYVAFAADVYGEGKTAESDEEAAALMAPLFVERKTLRERIRAAVRAVKQCPAVDPNKIGAIGFCFGGLTVIELVRSGEDIRGAVSFHGILGDTLGGKKARLEPLAKEIKSALLIQHGYEDPLVSSSDIAAIQKELNRANVDWKMDIYGHTSHAFTNPSMRDTEHGLVYNAKSSQRAWTSMRNFFEEIFK